MRALLETVRPWATAFDYGYMDEIPATYMLNYLCLAGPMYELHDQGYRGLWRRVASDFDVVCNARVTRVERAATVRVTTETDAFEFDDIVIACPLEAALEFIDASEDERSLFRQVRYVDYQVVGAEVSDLPTWRYAFIPKHFGRDAAGKPMFYYRQYPDRDVVTFYSFRGAGGLAGAQEEVESLQGARHTFYASEVLSFSCVEPVVAFATDLVRRHFDGDRSERASPSRRPARPHPLLSRLRSRPTA
jgi:hypothetical protein